MMRSDCSGSVALRGRVAGLLLVLNASLIAEPVRKYLIPSNTILPFADALAVSVALSLVLFRPHREIVNVLLAVSVLVVYGLLSVLVGHQNEMLALVGLRALLVPVAYCVLSFFLFRMLGLSKAAKVQHQIAIFWLVSISVVAMAQLLLGRDHPINQIPIDLGSDERQGIGDYTAGSIGREGLFRPTSIFLHTGKLGQITFVLATYSLFYRAATQGIGKKWFLVSLAEMLVLVLSGQRAAILLFILAVFVIMVFCGKRVVPMLLAVAVTVLAIGISSSYISASGDYAEVSIAEVVFARVMSAFEGSTTRFSHNVIVPLDYIIDRWGLLGEGLGAFSFGSSSYGGGPLYEAVPVGTAESSWLRIFAEQGAFGLVLHLVLLMGIVGAVWHRLRQWRRRLGWSVMSERLPEMLLMDVLFQTAALGVWANTHDVFGSVTTMSITMWSMGVLWAARVEARSNRR